jgi:hypothetical protein
VNAMRKRTVLPLLLLTPALIVRLNAAELAPLTSVELHELCLAYVRAPKSEDARACAAYVRGFIEGSDQVVIRSVVAKELRRESYSERAWRTRLGMSTPEPHYCLDKALSLRAFVTQVLMQAERKPPAKDMSASALLYATLSHFHRCSR